MSPQVAILIGSPRDWEVMRETGVELDDLGVTWTAYVSSAHRTLERTLGIVRDAESGGTRVFICAAGMAAHLAGVVAGCTVRPVIGVPLPGGLADGVDALLSTVQMPAGVPVAAVAVGRAGARNAAILAAQILAVTDGALEARLRAGKTAQAAAVSAADVELFGRRSTP